MSAPSLPPEPSTPGEELSAELRAKELLELFIDSSTDFFALFDQDFRILEVDAKLARLHGVTDRRELVGKSALEISPEMRKNGSYEQALRVMRTGVAEETEVMAVHPVAGERWISTKIFRVGKGFGTITSDVTERKLVEIERQQLSETLEARVQERTALLSRANRDLAEALEQLRGAQDQLVQAEKLAALGSLVAGVAHEINTPLGICVTASSHLGATSRQLLDTLAKGQLKRSEFVARLQSLKDASDLVETNLRRASDLVRSFKQVAADQTSEERRQVELVGYLEDVARSLRPALRKTAHELLVEQGEKVVVDTYPGAVWQCVSNAVMNALQHAFTDDRAGTITLSVSSDGGQARIVCADDGVGIAEEVRARVFDPFFTTRRGRGGTGLGLAIVYNLATETLGGHVRCETEVGRGTRLILTLPIRGGRAASSAPQPARDPPRALGSAS